MSKWFGGGPSAPAPLPAADPDADTRKQAEASRDAQIARANAGRKSTIVAGATVKDDQTGIGETLGGGARKKFGASQAMGM